MYLVPYRQHIYETNPFFKKMCENLFVRND